MPIRYNWLSSSGNATGLASGSVIGGNSVNIGDNTRLKIRFLAADVSLLADTSTFTWATKWQVSNDNSTWVDCSNGPQNAAAVVIATGTAGADTVVRKVIEAPETVYSWRYARIAAVTGGTTGATIDTYSLSYAARTA